MVREVCIGRQKAEKGYFEIDARICAKTLKQIGEENIKGTEKEAIVSRAQSEVEQF